MGRQIAVVQPPSGKDNIRLAKENYFDLAGNTIAQIVVSFDKDTLKPIKFKKRITRMEYDQLNQLVKIIQQHPEYQIGGLTTYQEYDLLGNIIKITDPLDNKINYRYDNLHRKISETNAEGGETKFTYDSVGRMASLTDPVGNKTYWSYNLLGRVSREQVINETWQTRFFYYDTAGNIVQKIDRNWRATEWTYDGLNRQTSEIWYDSWQSFDAKKQPTKKTYNNLQSRR